MSLSIPSSTLEKFTTFGDLLRFLRRRAGITQMELATIVGYSDTQISRLEQNQRPPDIPTIEARFISALGVEDEPRVIARLLDLAANVRREHAPGLGLCPYKGLSYFDEADADLFVGREALTKKLTDRLFSLTTSKQNPAETRFLAIVGASGSGKSSLVRAGLVPFLRWDKKSADWQIHLLTPTAHPLESLAASLTVDNPSVTTTATLLDDLARDTRSLHLFAKRKLGSDFNTRLLLVVDQFEELFALCHSNAERISFISNLLTAASEPYGPIAIVITLRADFYAHCAKYEKLREALAKNQEYIGAMDQDELRRAIQEPAERGRWEFESGLVDVLLHDVGQEPGALPLLSHALLETWHRRRGRTMTLGGYASSGGVHGAIAETAQAVFTDQFTSEQQSIARRIFLRLTELSDGASAVDTRRRATFDELVLKPEDETITRHVLKALADARLIITGQDSAEVAHEALIREWPTLRGWLEENRESLRLHRQLTEAAQEWSVMDRIPDMLFRGVRLDQAREWAFTSDDEMNPLEREFLAASIEVSARETAEKEAQRQRELDSARKLAEAERERARMQEQAARQLHKRALYLTGAFTIALVMVFTALFFGARARQAATRALESERIAFSRELALQSKLNLTVDPERSILLALTALDHAYSPEAENVLHEALSASRLRLSLKGHDGPVNNVAYDSDGTRIASAGGDGTARIWDARTGDALHTLIHPANIGSVAFSPDGERLATAAGDGVVRLWDVLSGRKVLSITVANVTDSQNPRILFISFSPDGKLLATVDRGIGKLEFWDPISGINLFEINDPEWLDVAPGVDLFPRTIAFSPDGKQLAIHLISNRAGLGRIEIWDMKNQQKVQTLDGRFDLPYPIVFNPDGTRIVAPFWLDEGATIWEVSTGELLFTLREPVNTIRYSTDGKRLLSASYGGIAKVFDAETGNELLSLAGHRGLVYHVAESPACVAPPVASFSWCGTHLASASEDGTIRVWDVSPAGNQELLTLPGRDFALSPSGTHIITTDVDEVVPTPPFNFIIQQWELPAGIRFGQISGYSSSSLRIEDDFVVSWSFPHDGVLAVAFENGILKFWDVTDGGKELYSISCCAKTEEMALSFSSRDENLAAIGNPHKGTVTIWDLKAGEIARILKVAESNQIYAITDAASSQTGTHFFGDNPIVLSPDGRRLATLKIDKTVDIWDVTTERRLLTLPGPTTLESSRLRFSSNGNLLAISDCTGIAVVWDVTTGVEVQRTSNDGACITGTAFSPDGKLIAVTSAQLKTKILNLETGEEQLTLPGGWLVQFTPDGDRVIIAMDEPRGLAPFTVRIYLVELNDVVALAKSRLTRSLTSLECKRYLHMEQCPPEP